MYNYSAPWGSTTDVQLVLVLLPDTWQWGLPRVYILSRASEVGSPSNHPGLRAATRHGVRDPLVGSQKRTVHLTRFLLRQGEPGTSQYDNMVDT